MAASIKISELNSLANLTDVDLFLVSDMETGTSRKISYNNLKSNIITETSSALTDLEGVVAQNRSDAEALVETVRVALQASIDNLIDNLDIDIAPETLNSIDELAQALGDDPQIITNLQAELTAYKAHIEERNLELALAFDVPTYAEIIYGG